VIQLFLLGAGVAVIRAVYLLRFPWGPCRRCQGRKTNKGSNPRRWGMCRKCGGTGQHQRFGAAAVHRFFWSVLGAALHKSFKDRIEAARKKAGFPET
jgi:hypothetical protein